jgi:plastocyanin
MKIEVFESCRSIGAAPFSAFAVALVFWLIAAPLSAATIKGIVRYTGGPVERKKIPVTIDQYVCGKEKESEDLLLSPANGIRNAVASLQNPPAGVKTETETRVTMDQKQCVFVPRVIIVPAGGTVEFLNSDRLLHNVKSAGKENPPFNRAQPHARSISFTFKKAETLRVDCDLHSWMRGWVVVAEHPFYAITNEQGEFILDNVPPGKYNLQIWHETLGSATQQVVVGEGGATVTVGMGKK